MTDAPSGQLAPNPPDLHPRNKLLRAVAIAAALFFALLCCTGLYVATHWPYSEARVRPGLEKAYHGTVHIETYRNTYFPEPGFVATGLSLRRGPTAAAAAANPAPPLATAQTLVVKGGWMDLLTLQHRIRLVDLDGLHLTIPPKDTPAYAADFPPGNGKDYSGPRTLMEHLHLAHSTLEIQKAGKPAFLLQVHDLLLLDVVKDHAAHFTTSLECPLPDALIEAQGTFGPLHTARLGQTRVSASYRFSRGRLEDFSALHGTLDATGDFHGPLNALDTSARATVQGFAVSHGRKLDGTTELAATVDGLTGDIALHSIDAHVLHTSIHGSGTISGSPKVTELDLSLQHGRIEDVLHPFLKTASPVSGDLHIKAHAHVAPVEEGKTFLERLQMSGFFDIPAEHFTKASTAESFSAFSRRAQGENPLSADARPQPLSPADPSLAMSLRGPVALAHGIASTPRLDVAFPGASMLLAGTFAFKGATAHLTGDLTMKSDIAHITTGWKSVLLKPLSPFFKHHEANAPEAPAVTVVPVAITGSGSFKVSSNLLGKK